MLQRCEHLVEWSDSGPWEDATPLKTSFVCLPPRPQVPLKLVGAFKPLFNATLLLEFCCSKEQGLQPPTFLTTAMLAVGAHGSNVQRATNAPPLVTA